LKTIAIGVKESVGSGIPSRISEHPVFVIRRAHQLASAIFAKHLTEQDLTSAQYCVLAVLQHHGSAGQNELGRLTHLDRCTISVVVRNLKARRLISAGKDETDSRKTLLALTAEGKVMLRSALRQSARAHDAVFSVLTDAETRRLMSTLHKLLRAHAIQVAD
jgi:DNA-binding MarR family transcriptional regulator